MSQMPPLPPNEGSSTDGIQTTALPSRSDSGQIDPMGGEKLWKIIERASIVLGGLGGVVGAIFAALAYFKPETPPAAPIKPAVAAKGVAVSAVPHDALIWPFLAVSIALLLTGWAMMAIRLRARKPRPEPIRHEPVAPVAPLPTSTPSPSDPPEITAAKLAMADFALKNLSPAIEKSGPFMSRLGAVVHDLNPEGPQAPLARNAVTAATPSPGHLRIFGDAALVRASTMDKLEHEFHGAGQSYSGLVYILGHTLLHLNGNYAKMNMRQFPQMFIEWHEEFESLQSKIKSFVIDINYPFLRANMSKGIHVQDPHERAISAYRTYLTQGNNLGSG